MTAFQVKRDTVTGSNNPAYAISKTLWETPLQISGELAPVNGGTGVTSLAALKTALSLVIADISGLQTALDSLSGGGGGITDPELLALAGLTSAANKLPYFTGSGTAALTDISALARTIIAITSANLVRVAINQGEVGLTDAATINTDCAAGNVFTVTLGGNRTLANPTNLQAGASYAWVVTQGTGGSRTLTYGNAFTWPGGTVPTLSTAAGAVDVITAIYSGSKLRAACNLAYA